MSSLFVRIQHLTRLHAPLASAPTTTAASLVWDNSAVTPCRTLAECHPLFIVYARSHFDSRSSKRTVTPNGSHAPSEHTAQTFRWSSYGNDSHYVPCSVSANVRTQRHAHCYRYTKHQQNNDAWVVHINRASRWPALGYSITSTVCVYGCVWGGRACVYGVCVCVVCVYGVCVCGVCVCVGLWLGVWPFWVC